MAISGLAQFVGATFCIAASLAAGSSRIGICAAIPPMAWISRRWQVLINSRL